MLAGFPRPEQEDGLNIFFEVEDEVKAKDETQIKTEVRLNMRTSRLLNLNLSFNLNLYSQPEFFPLLHYICRSLRLASTCSI